MFVDPKAVEQTVTAVRQRLLAARTDAGHWEGELSSSALSTATAVCALALLDRANGAEDIGLGGPTLRRTVARGLAWLAEHQNPDGGWGDTASSPSNISTTALCWAACGMAASSRPCSPSSVGVHDEARRAAGLSPRGTAQAQARGSSRGALSDTPGGVYPRCVRAAQRAEAWLKRRTGDLTPANIARAIGAVYGSDRTFSIPILTMCALAGRFGTGRRAWRSIPALPFELAACPHTWFRWLGLPVVSYALPALIAIGQVRHHHRPTTNPITRCLRFLTRDRTLRVLQSIQPESGGFIDAIPLTSFVVMSLASSGQRDHPVVERGRAFLTAAVRHDGSWPIDTNLATWVTTLSINALAGGGDLAARLAADERARLRAWLLGQQHQEEHSYTHTPPGGWAWTDLSGGVPDADDTSGALLALWHLSTSDDLKTAVEEEVLRAVTTGIRWLLGLQNRDGGLPTFCRGWGRLPFDRSSPDLTAHALRAWHTWQETLPEDLRRRTQRATRKAVSYLIRAQRNDGAWTPLWFGNQHSPDQESPLYGTTRVLRAGEAVSVGGRLAGAWSRARQRAVGWVLSAQNTDGGWGGAASVRSSIEETALALEALAGVTDDATRNVTDSVERGCAWLIEHTEGGARFEPTPIGLYFAKLWYFERLYPLIFTAAALERIRRLRPTA